MATFLIPTVALTLLIFLISPTPILVTGIVVDVDGEIVPNGGGKYYMLPYKNPFGAGPIGWVNATNSCPLYVTRTAFTEHSHSSTITLSSPFRSLFIPSGPIFIKFNDENTPCDKLLIWFANPALGIDVHFLNLAAGKNSQFPIGLVIDGAKIEGVNNVYELKFCEYVNEDGGPCYPIVEKTDNSGLLGVIYDLPNNDVKPFQFQLVKAQSSSFLKMKI